MTLRQTIKTYIAAREFKAMLRFFSPVKPITLLNGERQWFVMRPFWYGGNFSMRSINKARS